MTRDRKMGSPIQNCMTTQELSDGQALPLVPSRMARDQGSLWGTHCCCHQGIAPVPLMLETLYSALPNICQGGTSVLPAVKPIGLSP